MKTITWNCRWLGNGPTVRGLLNLQKEDDPDILFLSETKMDIRLIEWAELEVGFGEFGGQRLRREEWWTLNFLEK